MKKATKVLNIIRNASMLGSTALVLYYVICWLAGNRIDGRTAIKLIPIPVALTLLLSMTLLVMNLMELDHRNRSKDKSWVILLAYGIINAITSYIAFMEYEDVNEIFLVNGIVVIMIVATFLTFAGYTIILFRQGKDRKNKYDWEI